MMNKQARQIKQRSHPGNDRDDMQGFGPRVSKGKQIRHIQLRSFSPSYNNKKDKKDDVVCREPKTCGLTNYSGFIPN
jgi:hypothetical protein